MTKHLTAILILGLVCYTGTAQAGKPHKKAKAHPVQHDVHKVNRNHHALHQDHQALHSDQQALQQNHQSLQSDWKAIKSDYASGNTANLQKDLQQLHQDRHQYRQDRSEERSDIHKLASDRQQLNHDQRQLGKDLNSQSSGRNPASKPVAGHRRRQDRRVPRISKFNRIQATWARIAKPCRTTIASSNRPVRNSRPIGRPSKPTWRRATRPSCKRMSSNSSRTGNSSARTATN